ncbi:MAG: hypothetical protein AAF267_06175 [Deinococcota bacterium]
MMLHTMLAVLKLGCSSQAANAHQNIKYAPYRRLLRGVLGLVSIMGGQLAVHAQNSETSVDNLSVSNLDNLRANTGMLTLHLATYTNTKRAQTHADRLSRQGFDAYIQTHSVQTHSAQNHNAQAYGTQPDDNRLADQQRWQVRVGCFLNEAAATYTSAPLQTLTGRSSTLVPLTADADVRVCVDHQLGFLLPEQWQLVAKTGWAVAFEVRLAGQVGYVIYSDAGWQIMQNLPPNDVLQPWLLAGVDASVVTASEISEANQSEANQLHRFASLSVASSHEAVDVVVYQLENGTHVANDARVAESMSTPTQPQATQPQVPTQDVTSEQDMTPEERALARSLARLPAQPQVSLRPQAVSDGAISDDVARAQSHQNTSLIHSHVNNQNLNISSLSQRIIIATGDLLWQSPSAVVVQGDGQIVSLVMFPPPQHGLAEAPRQQHQLETVND